MEQLVNKYNEIRDTVVNALTPQQAQIISVVGIILSALLIFSMTLVIIKQEKEEKNLKKLRDKGYSTMSSSMEYSRLSMFNYSSIEKFLNNSGAKQMFKWLNPVTWLFIEIITALFGIMVGASLAGIIGAVIGCVIGFMFPRFVAAQSNSGDNKKLLTDLRTIYDVLRIQTKAGVYTSLILSDCYLSVRNKRLREALMELVSDIAVNSDMEEALEKFRSKFSNDYIDSLALVIKQSLVTGSSAQMLDDIAIQINNIEDALLVNQRNTVTTKLTFVQLLLYGSIIAVSGYIAVTAVTEGLSFMG